MTLLVDGEVFLGQGAQVRVRARVSRVAGCPGVPRTRVSRDGSLHSLGVWSWAAHGSQSFPPGGRFTEVA